MAVVKRVYGATIFGTRVDIGAGIAQKIVAQAMVGQHGIISQQPISEALIKIRSSRQTICPHNNPRTVLGACGQSIQVGHPFLGNEGRPTSW